MQRELYVSRSLRDAMTPLYERSTIVGEAPPAATTAILAPLRLLRHEPRRGRVRSYRETAPRPLPVGLAAEDSCRASLHRRRPAPDAEHAVESGTRNNEPPPDLTLGISPRRTAS